ncbi:MAG: ABC transporter permease subunit [Chloroflexi bacterium]|nr:ABC transporter permease subunit [Chloroflexota bacterium]
MTQTYFRPDARTINRRRSHLAWLVDLVLFIAIGFVIAGIVAAVRRWAAPFTPGVEIDLALNALPAYAGLSVLRMALAYVLSLLFSLIYARIAVASRPAEWVMLPLLDILQSIPILSFMPGVVLALVALFPGRNLGLEPAAIVLIFTSQAWNLAFGFHQSLVTIPKEMHEAATIYRLNAWRRFTRLELPFGAISLVWNSMMSWAGGWFFLMAAEQFVLGEQDFRLPGLGSYLQTAADAGDVPALLAGLTTLVAVIVLIDLLVWRPLVAWSVRFRVEQTEGVPTSSAILNILQRSRALAWFGGRIVEPFGEAVDRLMGRVFPLPSAPVSTRGGRGARVWDAVRVVPGLLIVLGAAGLLWSGYAAGRLLSQVTADDWAALGVGAAATLGRTMAAVAIGAAWTVPVGVAIGLNPRLARHVQPIVQIVAAVPATALFPVLLLAVLARPGGLEIAAIGLMLLGTQWYILFNVIAGASAIPTDLRDTADIYQVTGWHRWRYVILPAIFPYLVTGAITATGGAWNASVVSEYVTFGGSRFVTVGLGATIAIAADAADYPLLLAATVTMAAIVVLLNRFIWRRFYRLAERRYRLD